VAVLPLRDILLTPRLVLDESFSLTPCAPNGRGFILLPTKGGGTNCDDYGCVSVSRL